MLDIDKFLEDTRQLARELRRPDAPIWGLSAERDRHNDKRRKEDASFDKRDQPFDEKKGNTP